MKNNVINFNDNVKKVFAKKFSAKYSTISEKYVYNILEELERREYNLVNTYHMLETYFHIKDATNILAIGLCNASKEELEEVSELEKHTLSKVLEFKVNPNDTL